MESTPPSGVAATIDRSISPFRESRNPGALRSQDPKVLAPFSCVPSMHVRQRGAESPLHSRMTCRSTCGAGEVANRGVGGAGPRGPLYMPIRGPIPGREPRQRPIAHARPDAPGAHPGPAPRGVHASNPVQDWVQSAKKSVIWRFFGLTGPAAVVNYQCILGPSTGIERRLSPERPEVAVVAEGSEGSERCASRHRCWSEPSHSG